MKKLICCLSVLIVQMISAQTEDAWVFFKDKVGVTEALANPITILTQESIDRKAQHNVVIDERDVPVNEDYINQIKNTSGITILAKSKWFNCVYVRGDLSDVSGLLALDFVDSIDYADNSLDSGKSILIPQTEVSSVPNKFEVKTDFDYGNAVNQIQQLNGDYLHQQGFSGEDMMIAVMDSGFPGVDVIDGFKRARDEGRILDGYDFVDRVDNEFAFTGSSHGTQTFSDIAGFIEGQFVGTAPNAKYYLFRTEDTASEGPKEESLWVEAVERADSLGVDVINTSLGYSNGFDNAAYNYTTVDMDGQTTFISRGANIAFDKGMLLVTSAGNSGNGSWGIITAPGDAPGCLTIGAVSSSGNYVDFSSRGPTADSRIKPDVMARGSAAAVITSSNSVSTNSGTSFSGPIMAGVVTCLWQAFPSLTNGEIMQLVRESSSLFNTPTNEMGYGIPDFKSIFDTLGVEQQEFSLRPIIYPNPFTNDLFIDFQNATEATINIFTAEGKLILSTLLSAENKVSLDKLSTGIYILEINSGQTRVVSKLMKN